MYLSFSERFRGSGSGSGNSEVRLTSDEQQIGNAARLAAWAAGPIMTAGLGNIDPSEEVESKIGSRDIVTEVDKKCQEVIRDTLHSMYPSHKFLGEEDIEPGISASKDALQRFKNEPHLWIVDPVDGTTNFAHGMPLCGIIIAYAEYGVVKHGLIYDPFRNESFAAWEGKGAYLNGKRIRCCRTKRLDSSLVGTGSPPNIESLKAGLRASELISPKCRSMRIVGSAAINLCWIAVGRLTAYFEADLNAWDLAAGALLIKEAGGKVTDVWGKDYELSTRNTVASNGLIHDELLKLLQQSRMWIEDFPVEKEVE